jgi:hypothetical protein
MSVDDTSEIRGLMNDWRAVRKARDASEKELAELAGQHRREKAWLRDPRRRPELFVTEGDLTRRRERAVKKRESAMSKTEERTPRKKKVAKPKSPVKEAGTKRVQMDVKEEKEESIPAKTGNETASPAVTDHIDDKKGDRSGEGSAKVESSAAEGSTESAEVHGGELALDFSDGQFEEEPNQPTDRPGEQQMDSSRPHIRIVTGSQSQIGETVSQPFSDEIRAHNTGELTAVIGWDGEPQTPSRTVTSEDRERNEADDVIPDDFNSEPPEQTGAEETPPPQGDGNDTTVEAPAEGLTVDDGLDQVKEKVLTPQSVITGDDNSQEGPCASTKESPADRPDAQPIVRGFDFLVQKVANSIPGRTTEENGSLRRDSETDPDAATVLGHGGTGDGTDSISTLPEPKTAEAPISADPIKHSIVDPDSLNQGEANLASPAVADLQADDKRESGVDTIVPDFDEAAEEALSLVNDGIVLNGSQVETRDECIMEELPVRDIPALHLSAPTDSASLRGEQLPEDFEASSSQPQNETDRDVECNEPGSVDESHIKTESEPPQPSDLFEPVELPVDAAAAPEILAPDFEEPSDERAKEADSNTVINEVDSKAAEESEAGLPSTIIEETGTGMVADSSHASNQPEGHEGDVSVLSEIDVPLDNDGSESDVTRGPHDTDAKEESRIEADWDDPPQADVVEPSDSLDTTIEIDAASLENDPAAVVESKSDRRSGLIEESAVPLVAALDHLSDATDSHQGNQPGVEVSFDNQVNELSTTIDVNEKGMVERSPSPERSEQPQITERDQIAVDGAVSTLAGQSAPSGSSGLDTVDAISSAAVEMNAVLAQSRAPVTDSDAPVATRKESDFSPMPEPCDLPHQESGELSSLPPVAAPVEPDRDLFAVGSDHSKTERDESGERNIGIGDSQDPLNQTIRIVESQEDNPDERATSDLVPESATSAPLAVDSTPVANLMEGFITGFTGADAAFVAMNDGTLQLPLEPVVESQNLGTAANDSLPFYSESTGVVREALSAEPANEASPASAGIVFSGPDNGDIEDTAHPTDGATVVTRSVALGDHGLDSSPQTGDAVAEPISVAVKPAPLIGQDNSVIEASGTVRADSASYFVPSGDETALTQVASSDGQPAAAGIVEGCPASSTSPEFVFSGPDNTQPESSSRPTDEIQAADSVAVALDGEGFSTSLQHALEPRTSEFDAVTPTADLAPEATPIDGDDVTPTAALVEGGALPADSSSFLMPYSDDSNSTADPTPGRDLADTGTGGPLTKGNPASSTSPEFAFSGTDNVQTENIGHAQDEGPTGDSLEGTLDRNDPNLSVHPATLADDSQPFDLESKDVVLPTRADTPPVLDGAEGNAADVAVPVIGGPESKTSPSLPSSKPEEGNSPTHPVDPPTPRRRADETDSSEKDGLLEPEGPQSVLLLNSQGSSDASDPIISLVDEGETGPDHSDVAEAETDIVFLVDEPSE